MLQQQQQLKVHTLVLISTDLSPILIVKRSSTSVNANHMYATSGKLRASTLRFSHRATQLVQRAQRRNLPCRCAFRWQVEVNRTDNATHRRALRLGELVEHKAERSRNDLVRECGNNRQIEMLRLENALLFDSAVGFCVVDSNTQNTTLPGSLEAR